MASQQESPASGPTPEKLAGPNDDGNEDPYDNFGNYIGDQGMFIIFCKYFKCASFKFG